MNEITFFENPEFGKVRVVMRDDEPWFVATDVARLLGYENPSRDIQRHCKKVNKFSPTESVGTPYNIIPESDVYRLIMRSNMPRAEEFQTWVCEVVLPSIRKTGVYGIPSKDQIVRQIINNPVAIANLCLELYETQSALQKSEHICSELNDQLAMSANMSKGANCFYIWEAARLITQTTGVKMGGNKFFAWLRKKGWLTTGKKGQKNLPTQKALEANFMLVEVKDSPQPTGRMTTYYLSKITQKGLEYFQGKIAELNNKWLPIYHSHKPRTLLGKATLLIEQ